LLGPEPMRGTVKPFRKDGVPVPPRALQLVLVYVTARQIRSGKVRLVETSCCVRRVRI
jgi:hypothetical protein